MAPTDRPRSGLTTADYKVLAAFRHALRKFQHQSDENAQTAQLTPQQHQALLAIKGGDPDRDAITVGALAEALLLKHHSAVELVDRLARAGLVARARGQRDRRQVMVASRPRVRKFCFRCPPPI